MAPRNDARAVLCGRGLPARIIARCLARGVPGAAPKIAVLALDPSHRLPAAWTSVLCRHREGLRAGALKLRELGRDLGVDTTQETVNGFLAGDNRLKAIFPEGSLTGVCQNRGQST